jgi:hypothetical protein
MGAAAWGRWWRQSCYSRHWCRLPHRGVGGDGDLAGIPVDPGTGGCFRDSSVDGEVVRGWASYGVGNLKDGVRRGRRRARAKWIAKMVDWNYARTSATQANANESRSYSGETWLRDAVQEKPWDDNLIIANTI